jgi:hypothetical protein
MLDVQIVIFFVKWVPFIIKVESVLTKKKKMLHVSRVSHGRELFQ